MNPYHKTKQILDTIPLYDYYIVNRKTNVEELKAYGCKNPICTFMSYEPKFHHPYPLKEEDKVRLGGDVGFIGTYEKDRAETNKKIATVKGDIDTLKNKDRLTDKRVAENTAEIIDLKYKDEETDCRIKDLDDKIEKAKLGNAKIDSEQSKNITKNTETIASLDKRIIEVNKKVDGTISRISMLDSEIEKYHKVNILPKILVGLGIEIIRFGVYFGLITLILNRIA